ncbi:hypothetical protein AX14_000482 [Amanita brunnescens Koide BX004]|nr:hypothetical protein AX14_000482 [Amanita brunnescens Koide BX004]
MRSHEILCRCTPSVQFCIQYNYHRALIWGTVLTTFVHLIPDFSYVVAIEAVNEPITDAALAVHSTRWGHSCRGLDVPNLPLHLNVTEARNY